MVIVDLGHTYLLAALDGGLEQKLEFVKRNDPPEKYPGNVGSHGGTTIQEVLRVLIDRCEYVNTQHPSVETRLATEYLRQAIWQLEIRNATKKGRTLKADARQIEKLPYCSECFHIECQECDRARQL